VAHGLVILPVIAYLVSAVNNATAMNLLQQHERCAPPHLLRDRDFLALDGRM
jgi:hypothetical protein